MEVIMLHQLVTVESAPANMQTVPSLPAKSVTRSYPAVPQRGISIELERISRPATHAGHGESGAATPPTDLEMSQPASPVYDPADDGVEVLQSIWDPYMNRFRLLAACLMNFACGLSDSASGPLIPYMEMDYHIGYAIVSLIFVGQAVGFILGAGVIDPMREKLGRAWTLVVGQLLMAAGNIPLAVEAPFPVLVFGFFLIGLGNSLILALGNIFCGGLRNGTAALGAMHGSYGLGGICGPFIATAIVTIAKLNWSKYYFIILGLAVLNAAFVGWSYWSYEKDHPVVAHGLMRLEVPGSSSARSKIADIFKAFSSRVVLLGALFIFAYQGAEVSISGWVISFLIATRNGDPSSVGYVTSGFWGGITLGRFFLSIPAQKIGEKKFVYGVVAGAAIFELLVWLIPNVIGDSVALAIVGLLLGPVYPCAVAVFMRTMSRFERLSGLGIISAFGSSGGAVAPFTTGILAQVAGTFVLHPIAIFLFAVMLVCWYCLPSVRKRSV